MKMWKIVLPVSAVLLLAGQAVAQTEQDEARLEAELNRAEYSERLREAEERMEQAARQIAEITQERLPQYMKYVERRVDFSGKPRLGITIDGSEDSGAVDGVEIRGVTPEGAADDAGLRAGDVITAVNGESLGAASSDAANGLLLDFMHGVTGGDELKVEYLRNGNAGSVEMSPRVVEVHAFAWAPDGPDLHIEGMPAVPHIMNELIIDRAFPLAGSAWGRMELVELSEDLGKYFGATTGLLVVSAPEDDGLDLKDGDVIQTIDGREPKDVRHAMRILSSYQGGEKLKLGILRDKKKRTLDVALPDNHRGSLRAPMPVKPVRAPAPAMPHPGDVST
jgi:C-terminal processing protease CtpA/Prc